MKIYGKILLTTLPLVLFFLFTTVGTTYYFTRKALTELAETWLETRLSEAMRIAANHDAMLREYGLEGIPASIVKAKLDTGRAFAAIEVGQLGFIFAVDGDGIITLHPERDIVGQDVSGEAWFKEIRSGFGRLDYMGPEGRHLARYDYFEPWQWFIIATDPEAEVYGIANRMRPWVVYLGLFGAVVLAVALMFMTRRLTRPLRSLTEAAARIGRGEFETRIPVKTHDEVGQLAAVFNRMGAQLQATLTALQHREEHFRAMIENAHDITVILDGEGLFTYVSPSTERLLGYDPRRLIGRNAFDLIHPEDRDRMAERYRLRLAAATLPETNEFRFRHCNGTWRTLEGAGENLLDHPAVQGFVLNARDVSERKLAEAALQESHAELEQRVIERTAELTLANRHLREEIEERRNVEEALRSSEERLRAILRASPVGIGLVVDRRMNWCNEAMLRILRRTRQDLMGVESRAMYPDRETYERVGRALYSGDSQAGIGQTETRLLRGDGTLVDCGIRSYPLNPEDSSRGQIVTITDITERKRTQDMLMQTEKMVSVGGLAAGMAHEINNPLAGILQSVQVMTQRLETGLEANRRVAAECGIRMEDLETYIRRRGLFATMDTIIAAGRRAAKIVGNMLSFSRKSESTFEYHRLDRLLDQTIELAGNDYDFKTSFDFRKIDIVREYTPDTPAVQCESSKVQQVFLNILRNSSQAIAESDPAERPATPRFIFRVLPEKDRVRVEIEDNGPGMAKEVRKRAFEPFFTTKRVGVGTGLGLSVSYFIITENHRGTMEVKSSPGKGARFIIRIPIKNKTAA